MGHAPGAGLHWKTDTGPFPLRKAGAWSSRIPPARPAALCASASLFRLDLGLRLGRRRLRTGGKTGSHGLPEQHQGQGRQRRVGQERGAHEPQSENHEYRKAGDQRDPAQGDGRNDAVQVRGEAENSSAVSSVVLYEGMKRLKPPITCAALRHFRPSTIRGIPSARASRHLVLKRSNDE